MNKRKRTRLEYAKAQLIEATNTIADIANHENKIMFNTPENLKKGKRYEKVANASYCLEEALDHIDDAIECIDEAIS